MNLGSLIQKPTLLCPMIHYHHQRISSLRSTESSHILRQHGKGNGSISHKKTANVNQMVRHWCLQKPWNVPTSRDQRRTCHLVFYQVVLKSHSPERGAGHLPPSPQSLERSYKLQRPPILGKWTNPTLCYFTGPSLQRPAWSVSITSPKIIKDFLFLGDYSIHSPLSSKIPT